MIPFSMVIISDVIHGLAAGLIIVSVRPVSLFLAVTFRFLVTSNSEPAYVSRSRAITFCTDTAESGLTLIGSSSASYETVVVAAAEAVVETQEGAKEENHEDEDAKPAKKRSRKVVFVEGPVTPDTKHAPASGKTKAAHKKEDDADAEPSWDDLVNA